MHYLFIYLKILYTACLFSVTCSFAQTNSSSIHSAKKANEWWFRIDLAKNFTVIPYGGISLDAEVLYNLGEGVMIDIEFGYTNFNNIHREGNLKNYRSSGFYLKPGIEIHTKKNWDKRNSSTSLGFHPVAGFFKETGQFVFPGAYFGEAILPFERNKLNYFGFEFSLNTWLRVSKKFYAVFGTRINMISSVNVPDNEVSEIAVYYYSGSVIGSSAQSSARAGNLSGGFMLKLISN